MRYGMTALALVLTAGLGAVQAEAPPSEDLAAVVKGDNRFAVELYGRLRGQEGNLFFSPYSLSMALGMTYAGARGPTAEQMAATVHFDLPPGRLHPALAALIRQVNGEGRKRGYQLRTANALWGQKGYDFVPDFLRLTRDNYGAGLHEVDFREATEHARRTINAWVEKQTEDKIKDLIKQGMLTTNSRLVLTNAIYFKGDWARQFKKDQTRKGPFHVAAGRKVDAPLMHQTGHFGYFDGGAFQALEMPYVGNDLTMVVLLPKKADGLPGLEKALTADNLAGWLGKLDREEVDVTLPRFRTTSEFELGRVLSEMGMPLAFSTSADFSGMTREHVHISKVIHKAFVDVNEEGTEAAAATAVIIAAPAPPPMRRVFRADHPFVFLIRDARSGSILFLGRLTDPGK